MSVQVGKDLVVFFRSGAFSNLFASGMKVGLVDTATWSVDEGLEEYHGAGQRLPQAIVEGPKSITLSLDGLYLVSGAQEFFLNQIKQSAGSDMFHIALSGIDSAVKFSGCKIESLDQENTADGWSRLSVDIRALGIS